MFKILAKYFQHFTNNYIKNIRNYYIIKYILLIRHNLINKLIKNKHFFNFKYKKVIKINLTL